MKPSPEQVTAAGQEAARTDATAKRATANLQTLLDGIGMTPGDVAWVAWFILKSYEGRCREAMDPEDQNCQSAVIPNLRTHLDDLTAPPSHFAHDAFLRWVRIGVTHE
jgi:hypothetical protein